MQFKAILFIAASSLCATAAASTLRTQANTGDQTPIPLEAETQLPSADLPIYHANAQSAPPQNLVAPEPAYLALLGLGAMALFLRRRSTL
ncbi:PEP-CTERM sorting domain-containing protein [Hahella sp. KA22]|uniref:PEP-CTERM sorting domain-containing protein n=1 Tax=Hahella sp. KA22 TaxID=1628392 RepID=UPI000FDDA942|nr:PEP-CTERM sorting domain-containing protein [Hahella sp. KA22]AZZ93954.1 PEP-CTERM sorting domain-containing protein [Hahella sp. KA22]QAY57328.1 PEP-CTERM sorting domain-containing protein [Hahella sp. KA22]